MNHNGPWVADGEDMDDPHNPLIKPGNWGHQPAPEVVASEHSEQAALIQWARLHEHRYSALRMLWANVNGGKRTKRERGQKKAEGMRAGVPDLFLAVARQGFHGLFIEMKRRKGGHLEKAQRDMKRDLEAEGYRVEVCRGWEAARDALVAYLTPLPASAYGLGQGIPVAHLQGLAL